VKKEVRRTRTEVNEFRRGLKPLADAAKLGALLVQFPPSFKADAKNKAYLTWLLDAFRRL
jgi:uncharacterized protein YecE (DUF72 family)